MSNDDIRYCPSLPPHCSTNWSLFIGGLGRHQTEFVKCLMTASGIALHSPSVLLYQLFIGGLGQRPICWPRWSHKCSISDRSGEQAGHGKTLTLFVAKNCCTTRVCVRSGELSGETIRSGWIPPQNTESWTQHGAVLSPVHQLVLQEW